MSEKAKCVIAYIFGWIGGLIVLLGMKDSERNTKFHAAQSITLSVGYMVASFVLAFIPYIGGIAGWALSVVYLISWIMGIVKASKGEDPELPVVGGLTKSIFGKQIDG